MLSSAQSQQALTKNVNIHDCDKLRRCFSQLSFMYVLFSFNIFLITYFRVVLSFEPPIDHNTVLIQTIQFSISTVFFVYTQLNDKIVLFQTIQFSISKQFSSI